ncbi:hypothetical protein AVEN_189287-1 [Araneus ventricosus]|uniref:Uncharacterized protein n=1 Tax=Araneus ventricosus TaxID=182803 RepID=A0A4Y2MY15_ARAVE|nr:hypothetical protein AVEN_189287-1 [Araneus ventricosus]
MPSVTVPWLRGTNENYEGEKSLSSAMLRRACSIPAHQWPRRLRELGQYRFQKVDFSILDKKKSFRCRDRPRSIKEHELDEKHYELYPLTELFISSILSFSNEFPPAVELADEFSYNREKHNYRAVSPESLQKGNLSWAFTRRLAMPLS